MEATLNRAFRWGAGSRLAALVLGALCLCAGPSGSLAAIVTCDGQRIGTVEAPTYSTWYHFNPAPEKGIDPHIGHAGPRITGDISGGARFEATFSFEGCPAPLSLRPDAVFNWVQIVYTDAPLANPGRGAAPTTGYVDPWSPPNGGSGPAGDYYEDAKPFYWTDAELRNVGIGGDPAHTNTLFFKDSSMRGFTDAGIKWSAELNLVCTWDNVVHPLGYYTWGWNMPADMAKDPTKEISLNPLNVVWRDGASPGLPKLELATEFGGARGWRITDQSCCIPEPSTLALLLFAAPIALRKLRR